MEVDEVCTHYTVVVDSILTTIPVQKKIVLRSESCNLVDVCNSIFYFVGVGTMNLKWLSPWSYLMFGLLVGYWSAYKDVNAYCVAMWMLIALLISIAVWVEMNNLHGLWDEGDEE